MEEIVVTPQPRHPLAVSDLIAFARAILRNDRFAHSVLAQPAMGVVMEAVDLPLGRVHMAAWHDAGDIAATVDHQGVRAALLPGQDESQIRRVLGTRIPEWAPHPLGPAGAALGSEFWQRMEMANWIRRSTPRARRLESHGHCERVMVPVDKGLPSAPSAAR